MTDIAGSATLVVTASPAMVEPDTRFQLAFDSPTLEPDPVWTSLDEIPNLVASYTIDRGRAYELDRTDAGRATVQITDPDGLLDPTNADGPWYGKIQPLLQAQLGRRNPCNGEWASRFRGYVENFEYEVDPTQRLNRLTVSLVDLFEILSAAEMHPGEFGVTPPAGSEGQVFYPAQSVYGRIFDLLRDMGLPKRLQVIMPGAVDCDDTIYSPGEPVLAAVQEAADAEMPGSNLACDRAGRIVFHDRRSRFDPAGVLGELGWEKWDYREWRIGDGAAVTASPTDTVQVRQFGFNRSLSRVINSASATPVSVKDEDVAGQLVVDPTSIGLYGIRSWSADRLLTFVSLIDGANALVETRRFAEWIVANYAEPQDRISTVGFRSLRPDDPRAPALWQFLLSVDIGDSVDVHVATKTGGFESVWYFVEGIHEDVKPLVPGFDDVTLTLDLSPRSYYDVNPWPDA